MNAILPIRLNVMLKVFLLPASDGAGAVLIDAGMPGQAGRILEELAKHGFKPDMLRLILITHGHTDHFGSARDLRARTGAPVAVHAADSVALRRGVNPPEWNTPAAGLLKALAGLLPSRTSTNEAIALEPDIVFEEEWRLDAYGVAAQVLHTPGHTPGSITVHFDTGEMIVGDLVRGHLLQPRRPAPPFVALDLDQNWQSLARLMALGPREIHVSHWGPLKPADAERLMAQTQ